MNLETTTIHRSIFLNTTSFPKIYWLEIAQMSELKPWGSWPSSLDQIQHVKVIFFRFPNLKVIFSCQGYIPDHSIKKSTIFCTEFSSEALLQAVVHHPPPYQYIGKCKQYEWNAVFVIVPGRLSHIPRYHVPIGRAPWGVDDMVVST